MIKKNLSNCLKEVFRKERIPKNIENLQFGSFDTWDSLYHLNLLLLIEKKFKVKIPFLRVFGRNSNITITNLKKCLKL